MRAPMIRASAVMAAIAVLGGCGQVYEGVDESVALELAPPPASVPAETSVAASDADQSSLSRATAPRLAYAYAYRLEVPVKEVGALVARHEALCVRAGPATCQVIGSRTDAYGRDARSAALEMRVAPAFLTSLRQQLADDAQTAGGRVVGSSTTSEDLTRQMIDGEARLRALSTLRDRLQQLLATRTAPLDQLLKLEAELARVQGELDAARSNLEQMRTRVATSRLTVEYGSTGQLAPDSALRPLTSAFENALAVFMGSLGFLVLAVAALLPILLVAVPLIWLLIRLRRRAKTARANQRKDAKPDQS